MSLNKGDVFGAGVRILKKSATEALDVNAGPVSYLHFVRESDGATIVPEYEPDGLATYAGPLSGAKITIPAPDLSAVTEQLAALAGRVAELEAAVDTLLAGGSWTVPDIVVGVSGPESTNLALGSFHRFNLENYGSGDVMTATLPLVGAGSVGRRVAVTEMSGFLIGFGQPELHITTTASQAIDGRTLPLELAGTRPRIVFVAVLMSAGVYGWSVESYDAE